MLLPTEFDYHYFDNPNAHGYQGYKLRPLGSNVIELWEIVTDFCIDQKIISAVDIGCAKGFLVQSLLSHKIRAIGYDISDYALSFAQDLPCFKHDIRKGVQERAEVVIALGVLMYISEIELDFALREIYQATERFFIFSCYYEGMPQRIPDPLRIITRSMTWWRSKIESNGFNVVKSSPSFEVYSK